MIARPLKQLTARGRNTVARAAKRTQIPPTRLPAGGVWGPRCLDPCRVQHYTRGMRRLRAHLHFGASVHPADLPRLRRVGITAVLSLQQPGVDLPHAAMERMRAACEPRVVFHNVGIHDYDPDAVIAALPRALAVLHGLIGDGRIVYLHCSEGINRAPSVALAHLVQAEGLDVDAALADLRGADPGVRPYAAVIDWLRRGP